MSYGARLSLLVVAGACLLAPSSAGAQNVVFGSDLVSTPNLALGCESQPQIVGSDGAMALMPSGQPDCTWRLSGVFGAAITDPRHSTVPGDGRITLAEVRSGPTPAPLRFVILQQVETVCCYFVSETAPIALAPDAVTRVPLNLPVQRNSIGGVQVYDFVAVSAVSGTGSLPLHTNGLTNAFQQTVPGNPSSGLWYPRLGAIPGDGRPGGGRREQGAPGSELLVRWTWTPPGQAGPVAGPAAPATTAPNGNPNASIAPALLNRTLRVQNNRTLIQLLCQGNAACAGRLDLVNRTALRAGTAKRIVYGRASYSIRPGTRAKVRVTLNAKGRALFRKRGRLALTLRVRPTSGPMRSSPVVLK